MKNTSPKQVVTITLDPELVKRMKAWISTQELPPPQNAVMAAALKEYLDRREAAEDWSKVRSPSRAKRREIEGKSNV